MEFKYTVLVVEDEKNIASFIKTMFEANGFSVIVAHTGNEAVMMINSHCPDVIILDLGLPDMDGMDIKELSHYIEEEFSPYLERVDGVATVERQHEEEYKKLIEKVKNDKMFCSKKEETWKCLNCGHTHKGLIPPQTCPVCSHPQAYCQEYSSE